MGVEQRKSYRKDFLSEAVLTIDDAESIPVQTLDLARYGIGLVGIPAQMVKGKEGHLVLKLPVNGSSHEIRVRVRIIYCLIASHGYKAGLQFIEVDAADAMLISYYVSV